jgi:hypothetical protein
MITALLYSRRKHERLIIAHINSILPDTLDPICIPPQQIHSDAISIVLYTALSHLDKRNTYENAVY